MCTLPKPESKKSVDETIAEAFHPNKFNIRNIDWTVFFWITAMHVGALFAPFVFSWSGLVVALILHWFTASIGICLGFHRYLSHRSLKLRLPAKLGVLLAGALSAEGTPRRWAAIHRMHHAKSDQDGDPHSPLVGPWWAHLYWMFVNHSVAADGLLLQKYAPDIAKDRLVRFFDRTFILWSLGLGVLLYSLGGWSWLVWGLFLRMTLCYHSTWFVNSATHLWGYRNYETRDQSRNLWWVAILAYGEGWHNNHHAHPALAPAGHKWWEFDITMWSIRFLQLVGQAYDVKDRIPEPHAQLTEFQPLEPVSTKDAALVAV